MSMKSNAFSDRVRLVSEWFQSWNNCEQTIALYSLLSKVSPTQARFLSLVLEHSLQNGFKSPELTQLEKQANNSTFLSSLHSESEEQALCLLLTHLPLLHPASSEARTEYMKLLPKVMLGSSEELDYLDQCRQLLSLALVHPAFPQDEREALTFWFSQLDRKQRLIVDRKAPSPTSRIYQIKSSPEESSSWSLGTGPGSGRINISGELHLGESDGFSDDELKSNSLPPGQSLYNPLASVEEPSLSYEEYVMAHIGKGVAGMSPMTSMTAPGGMSHNSGQEEFTGWKEGMKDVPLWLKSLRLHKYQSLFVDMEYEQMLCIGEDYLTSKGVTKGARTKIILSIRKIARRPETLVEIEQDMEKHGRLVCCIQELRQMMATPIKPYNHSSSPSVRKTPEVNPDPPVGSGDEEDESKQQSSSDSELEELLARDFPHEDLPSLITRAMGKGFSTLMSYTDTNEENLSSFIKLLDSALQHEVFTIDQKNLFFDWKQQCTQTLRVISPKKSAAVRGRNFGGFHTIHTVPSATASQLGGARGSKTRSLRSPRMAPSAKGLSLPVFSKPSSTLPRMSARQLQQAPLTHHPPAFLRPNSLVGTSYAGGPTRKGFPLANQTYSASPPLPPRGGRPDSDNYMNDLPQRVAEHALDEEQSDH